MTTNLDITILLVGHKLVLINQRIVNNEDALKISVLFKIDYIEASAKTNTKIKESFDILCKKFIVFMD